MDGIKGLQDKIEKDVHSSEKKISQLQSKIQSLVAERKNKKITWEKEDEKLAEEITSVLQEISIIQGRQLAGQDLINYLNS